MKLKPKDKARLIDDVIKPSEELTAKTISKRVEDLHGVTLNSREIGCTIKWHMSHFINIIRRDSISCLFSRVDGEI